MPRAVQQLRRIRSFLGEDTDPVLACRVNERLAYYLLEIDAMSDAEAAALAATAVLPGGPAELGARPGAGHARPDADVHRCGGSRGGARGPGPG